MGEKSEKWKEERWEEKWKEKTREVDSMSYLFWGLIVIAVGASMFLERQELVSSWWWTFVFFAGVILLLDSAVRSATGRRRGLSRGRITWGVVMIAAGLFFEIGETIAGDLGFPFFLILVGILVIIWGASRAL